jgi:hypothetical protein
MFKLDHIGPAVIAAFSGLAAREGLYLVAAGLLMAALAALLPTRPAA